MEHSSPKKNHYKRKRKVLTKKKRKRKLSGEWGMHRTQ